MNKTFSVLILCLFPFIFIQSQSLRVIESNDSHIIFEVNFNGTYTLIDTVVEGRVVNKIRGGEFSYREPGEPWIPNYGLNVGIPIGSSPSISILSVEESSIQNKFIIPFPIYDPDLEYTDINEIDQEIYSSNSYFPNSPVILSEPYFLRFANILPVNISPYQFNPVTRELKYNNRVRVKISYNENSTLDYQPVNDKVTRQYLQGSILNYNEAVNWIGKPIDYTNAVLDNYWYDSNKDYYKIFLKNKGVYRLTYTELISNGVPLGSGTPIENLELYNDGEFVAIDIVDSNSDQIFNSGDYLQFVGFPPTPTPYSNFNIYNNTNVYWFSYQGSGNSDAIYNYINGTPGIYNKTYAVTKEVVHYERDSLFERLGYAPDDNRDYWYWGKATAQNGQALRGFEKFFTPFDNRHPDSNYVTLRTQLHGITNSQFCITDHKAYIELTNQPLGHIIWDGQRIATFEKKFYISNDSIKIYPTGNRFNVWVRGDICQNVFSDEIRVNWFEFEYWRVNRTEPNHFSFTSPDEGIVRFWLINWQRNNMKVYIPSKNKLIYNPKITNDQYNSVLFVDTTNVGEEYFTVADDYFLTVDSIRQDQSSSLRSAGNEADYIIITHPDFISVAQRLKNIRENDFPDTTISNPKIFIADVEEIYDEFSYGLLDPYAIREFVKYTVENWSGQLPSYVVLLGDMSYDYRNLNPSSRPNFVPSIPYYSFLYGQAASDNMFVAVVGEDIVPDLAIGRLSCESIEEGNILLDKLETYPADDTKAWQENVLVLASGLSLEDENLFGFNDASLDLCQNYVVPFGYVCTKVFRFPSKPAHEPFQGEGPKIRAEMNKGAALVNYYGHGGGEQWDLVFTNDDIYLLENGGRLPVVLSVTCYTAHFDNQNIFGEIFNEVEGKGSIAFYGSSGLTYWSIGKSLNRLLFSELFNRNNHIMGNAILKSKTLINPSGATGTQIALLTFLGDPVLKIALPEKPDFMIEQSGISITPKNPLTEDTVQVKILLNNFGRVFTGDSVFFQLHASSPDTNYLVGSKFIKNFGQKDSVYIQWIPQKGGLFELTASINEVDSVMIDEDDHSDNIASEYFVVFNISEPSAVKPMDGHSTDVKVHFRFSDIGHYINRELTYFIEIDTTTSFQSPVISSGALEPLDAVVDWYSPNLTQGTYFWRARIFDGQDYGNWSTARSFSIMTTPVSGYFAKDNILETYDLYNVNYSDSLGSLLLNNLPLSPRPSNTTLLDTFLPNPQVPDSLRLTTITTDGTYLYAANLWFFMLPFNSEGKSAIYRIGTGNNGTMEGEFYGKFSNFYDKVLNTITYHSDGHIYVATGTPYQLTRINVSTEFIDTVIVNPGLIDWESALPRSGAYYIQSDGEYIYNLAIKDSSGNKKYTLRILDPSNNWQLVKPDMQLTGTSYVGFSDFFVFNEYLYITENFYSNYMRRFRLEDGFFEEEWIAVEPFQAYYSWTVDKPNNHIYASVYRGSGFTPKFSRFVGNYIDANGRITSSDIGPVKKWKTLNYDLYKPTSEGSYSVNIEGLNSNSKNWDTLAVDIPESMTIDTIDADVYTKLRLQFSLTDTTFGASDPMELRSMNVDYVPLPEVILLKDDFVFNPDSMLQGLPIEMKFKARNIGDTQSDSIKLRFSLTELDANTITTSPFAQKTIFIPPDSVSEELTFTINTDTLLFNNSMRALVELESREYFSFNNLVEETFYVKRDTTDPLFQITFDGKEILDGDIISAEPVVEIILEDNSPLPLDTSYFTLVHNNIPLRFSNEDLNFVYEPYPNSKATITWTPVLPDGKHTLEVLAKDASGNFFDSTSFRKVFYVFSDPDLTEVYNYPNPFTDETYFTFEVRGVVPPEELRIKVFTVAGRLIREIDVPPTLLQIGFNQLKWDGRDQDGDEIANGVYFYKVISKHGDEMKTTTQKLAKVK